MSGSYLGRLLDEYRDFLSTHSTPSDDADLVAIHTAIFFEDTLDLRISDDQIDSRVLADPASVRKFLNRSAG